MSAKGKKSVVPRLRFAEFRETEVWSNSSLEELYSFKATNSFSREQLNYEIGEVKNIHYGDIHTKFSSSFNIKEESVPFIKPTESLEKIKHDCYCEEGDIIFADASEDLNDVGKSIEIVSLNNQKLLSGLHTLLIRQKKLRLVIGFGGYLFKSSRIRAQIKREAQGTKILGISSARISRIDIAFPINKKEQQKIAACLTALDDLISAATGRLDALKQHKQGLMQQLFPAQGETVPRLHFAEFRDSGEWERKKLENIGEPLMCKRIFKSQTIINSENAVPFYKIGTFGRVADSYISCELYNEYKSKYSFPNKGDILISASGTIGRLVVYNGEAAYFQDSNIVWLGHNEELIKNNFLFYCYSILNWQTSDGGIIKRLYNSDLNNIKVCFPKAKKEQQKIAACLTALDDLISAQAQKIAKLKTHKRGLMQQLFPAVDETH